ncbi:hypothetical protein ABG067_004969 [Albugo candida]
MRDYRQKPTLYLQLLLLFIYGSLCLLINADNAATAQEGKRGIQSNLTESEELLSLTTNSSDSQIDAKSTHKDEEFPQKTSTRNISNEHLTDLYHKSDINKKPPRSISADEAVRASSMQNIAPAPKTIQLAPMLQPHTVSSPPMPPESPPNRPIQWNPTRPPVSLQNEATTQFGITAAEVHTQSPKTTTPSQPKAKESAEDPKTSPNTQTISTKASSNFFSENALFLIFGVIGVILLTALIAIVRGRSRSVSESDASPLTPWTRSKLPFEPYPPANNTTSDPNLKKQCIATSNDSVNLNDPNFDFLTPCSQITTINAARSYPSSHLSQPGTCSYTSSHVTVSDWNKVYCTTASWIAKQPRQFSPNFEPRGTGENDVTGSINDSRSKHSDDSNSISSWAVTSEQYLKESQDRYSDIEDTEDYCSNTKSRVRFQESL